MIIADTDILSALAKVKRLPLLFALFQTDVLHITPGVYSELEHSFDLNREYAKDVFDLLNAGQIQVTYLTQEEIAFRDNLPISLGLGEREGISAAKERRAILLSNESRVAHACRQFQIACVRLPDILRAVWVEGLTDKAEVQNLIRDLEIRDRMQFKPETITAIFVDP